MRYFLDRQLTVRRLRSKDLNRMAFSATGTAYPCSFQDLQPSKVQYLGGEIGKTYEVFVPNSNANIEAGDEIIVRSIPYSVMAKEVVDFGGQTFIDLIVIRKDSA